ADKDALVRTLAVKSLARTGMPPAAMKSAIVAASRDADAGVRLTAVPLLAASWSAGKDRDDAVARLVEFPDDPSDACRSAAIRALVAMNAKEERVIAAFARDMFLHPIDRQG